MSRYRKVKYVDWPRVNMYIWDNYIQKKELARAAGLNYHTMLATLNGRSEGSRTVAAIFTALNLDVNDYMLPQEEIQAQMERNVEATKATQSYQNRLKYDRTNPSTRRRKKEQLESRMKKPWKEDE